MRAGSAGSFISTYSGAGGLDLGFVRAGFACVWANDVDRSAVETHNQLLGEEIARVGDVAKQRLPSRGTADLVVGGPPCQGFSVAGKMDASDPRSDHVWQFLRIVERTRPKAFVMENVKSLATSSRWAELRDGLLCAARGLGFSTRIVILNASHFDVAQARERMFMIGIRGGAEVHIEPVTASKPPTVREALAALPSFGSVGNDTPCIARVTAARTPVLRRSPFSGMLFNGKGRPLNLDRPASTLPASMGGNRTPILDQREIEQGTRNWAVGYHRRLLNGSDPVSTVPPFLRRISVEEAAALQSFPIGMVWAGERTAQYRQIGNAVPPSLAYHVALGVRAALLG